MNDAGRGEFRGPFSKPQTECENMAELEQAAREAWAAMIAEENVFTRSGLKPGPMAPAIALDMVQDVTGERDDAVMALLNAAAQWLTLERVGAVLRGISAGGSEVHNGNVRDADLLTDYLRSEELSLATTHLTHIIDRSRPAFVNDRAEASACEWWIRWEKKASRALQLCREMIEAAYPAA